MGVAGSISPPGGAPKPDPERVATLRYTLVDEPGTCAAFGEPARAALAALDERALAETRAGDLGECARLLDEVRDRVAGLDPARLQPRGGIAGLFDSRGKRLKAFRAAWTSAADAVARSAADLGDHAAALARKDAALETLWSETRDAIAELDAHIAAARSWLAHETPAPAVDPVEPPEEAAAPDPAAEVRQPVEAVAGAEAGGDVPSPPVEDPVDEPGEVPATSAPDAEPGIEAASGTDLPAPVVPEAVTPADTVVLADVDGPVETLEIAPETAAEPEPRTGPEPERRNDPGAAGVEAASPVIALPHPLETRLAGLEALRAAAIGRLPLLRAAQNADCRTPAALKQVCDGVEAWRADWQDALGLTGRKPKKVVPDRVRLSDATSALTDRIDAAGREVSAARGRRAELETRSARTPERPALAA